MHLKFDILTVVTMKINAVWDIYSEDGGSMFLQNIFTHLPNYEYMVSHPRRH
jgi:hypothetical protein